MKILCAILLALQPGIALADKKLAEYGDPVVGNSFSNCSFEITFSTGTGYFYFDEYLITGCDSGEDYIVGVTEYWNRNGFPVCHFAANGNAYYVDGNCGNWRVYKKSATLIIDTDFPF